jgi:hypothetical protein
LADRDGERPRVISSQFSSRLVIDCRDAADEIQGEIMLHKEPADQSAKKPYAKPHLATHGSVQKLTEKVNPLAGHSPADCGSNVRFPVLGQGHDSTIW